MSDFVPSDEQTTIFAHIGSAERNLTVEACPGSGKTTTVVHSFSHIPRDGIVAPSIAYLVFNKRNAGEAKGKCPPSVSVSTFHALGRRALVDADIVRRNVEPDGSKCKKRVWNALDRNDPDAGAIIRLVSLLKTQCERSPDASVAESFIAAHDLNIDDRRRAIQVALDTLAWSNANTSVIDFDDMLYLPVILGLNFRSWDWLFVDEAQDTNDIQLHILRQSLAHDSRIVAVGDRHQAIYGFRGANFDAMDRITQAFDALTLNLSVSYRCSQSVAKEAQKYE